MPRRRRRRPARRRGDVAVQGAGRRHLPPGRRRRPRRRGLLARRAEKGARPSPPCGEAALDTPRDFGEFMRRRPPALRADAVHRSGSPGRRRAAFGCRYSPK
jgi:hypothetical protein